MIPASLWGFHLHITPAEQGVVTARTPPAASALPWPRTHLPTVALGWHQGAQGKPQQLSNHAGTYPQSSSPLKADP